MNNEERLKLLEEKVSTCKKCKLCETRKQTVFGQGNLNSKIVLIGEGPGRDEDIQGIPFCGRCGQLLTQLLAANGIEREAIYICNIVKCRPPRNRPPEPEEVKACKPYLDLQLKVLNPKYIVCLGATAAQNVLDTGSSIGFLRGRWHQYGKTKVIATFHPAYLLRNPSAVEQFHNDFQLLIQELNNGT